MPMPPEYLLSHRQSPAIIRRRSQDDRRDDRRDRRDRRRNIPIKRLFLRTCSR